MTSPGLLTFEDFERLPESVGKQELLDGELIELPPAKMPHLIVAKRFQKLFETVLHDSRVWIEAGYRLRNGWLIPDASVSWLNQPVMNGYMQGGPMVAVEVESPGNTAEELDRKVTAYLQNGAGEVWVVYPRTQSMLVHTSSDQSILRVTATYESPLLPGLTVDLQHLLRP